jgi:hypothetical protein
LFVGLAREQGWLHTAQLATACACSPRNIRRLMATLDAVDLTPARLCLGDPRLLHAIPTLDLAAA